LFLVHLHGIPLLSAHQGVWESFDFVFQYYDIVLDLLILVYFSFLAYVFIFTCRFFDLLRIRSRSSGTEATSTRLAVTVALQMN